MIDEQAIQKRLAALYAGYAQELPQHLDEVGVALRRLAGVTAASEIRKALADVCRRSHSIAGTAGSYGYPEVSKSLRELEELAAAQLATDDRHTESWCGVWIERIAQLKHSVAAARER